MLPQRSGLVTLLIVRSAYASEATRCEQYGAATTYEAASELTRKAWPGWLTLESLG